MGKDARAYGEKRSRVRRKTLAHTAKNAQAYDEDACAYGERRSRVRQKTLARTAKNAQAYDQDAHAYGERRSLTAKDARLRRKTLVFGEKRAHIRRKSHQSINQYNFLK